MKTEKPLIGVVFLSIVLTSLIAVSSAATVSQEEYDKLAAELSAAQSQVRRYRVILSQPKAGSHC